MEKTVEFKKNEKTFLFTCLIFLLILSVLLFVEVCRKSEIQADDQGFVGRILFLGNDAWRKFTPHGPLEGLQVGSRIYSNDIVITGDDSPATIALNDGTMLDLCKGSAGTFERTDGGIIFTLERGCGDFRRTGDGISGDNKLMIVANGKKITLDEGELSLAGGVGRDPEILVRSGEAAVFLKNDRETIGKNDRAVITGDSISIEKKKLILTNPEDNRRYFITGGSADVSFRWEQSGSGSDDEQYLFEIGRSEDFSRSFRSTSLADSRVSISVPAGEFFWRVSRKDRGSGRLDVSETRRLSVLRDSPLVLLNPSDGEMLEYIRELPSINFTWKGHRYADSYRLEISDRNDFSKILESIDSRVVNYTLPWEQDVERGSVKTYYWRVTAGNRQLNWPGRTSSASHFYIQRLNKLNRPVLVSPKDRKKIIRPRATTEHVIFSWERTDENLIKRIFFSKDKDFSGIYREVPLEPDHWVMTNTFPEGTYYWRVALYDREAKRDVLSGTRSFVVQEVEDIYLLSPEDGTELITGDIGERGIRFKWDTPDVKGTSILEISDSRDFKTIRKSARTSSNTITMDGLDPGGFFWRVKLQNEREKIIAGSEMRAFTVHGGLDAPMIISPRRGGAVEMLTENELNFLWKRSRHANAYQFELHQLVNEKEKIRDKLVLSTQTGNNKYTVSDLSLLDVGNFYWTLKAIKKDRRGRVVRFSKAVKNNFNIKLGESNIIIVSPEIQVIEDNKTK